MMPNDPRFHQWLCEECKEEAGKGYEDWTGIDHLFDETDPEQMVCDGCGEGELDLQMFAASEERS